MHRKTASIIISLFLCAAMLLSLCGCNDSGNDDPAHTEDGTDSLSPSEPNKEDAPVSTADSVFTMNYDPDSSFNPLTATNVYNKELFGLLYEGLFSVNDAFEAEALLCESFASEDGITWLFTLRSDIMFHDGSTLTASDAVYSINQARVSANYASRLSKIASAISTGTLSFQITLTEANQSLPVLLDFPIIKEGSGEDDAPTGTGPYLLSGTYGANKLSVYEGYRDRDALPLNVIHLKNVSASDLAEEFSGRGLDILNYDPTGLQTLNVHLEYETRYYNTTTLLYLGFNTITDADGNYHKNAVSDPLVRQAIGRLLDRDAICRDILNNAVRPAPLILSSALPFYDAGWEADTGYSLQAFSTLFSTAGMEDTDNDGYLENPSGDFTVKILVNKENPYKVSIGEKLYSDLRNTGIYTELSILPWDEFLAALSAGDFSIYIGEAKLQPDFDLSPLLTEDGSLNYGGVSGAMYSSYIQSFLFSAGEAKVAAARVLCEYVRDQAAMIPIAYKNGAVLTHIGTASGLSPSLSNTFYALCDWNINLGS